MKQILLFSALILIFNQNIFSQSTRKLTDDERVRIKLSIPLETYDTVGTFDNAIGEATYKLVVASFTENLTIPKFNSTLTANDKSLVDKYIKIFNQLLQFPPDWDELNVKQTQYLKWQDKVIRRKSKYKE